MTRWDMIKACWGDLRQWREACEKAKRDGWKYEEVQWIVNLCHPFTVLMVVVFSLVIISFIAESFK